MLNQRKQGNYSTCITKIQEHNFSPTHTTHNRAISSTHTVSVMKKMKNTDETNKDFNTNDEQDMSKEVTILVMYF